MEGLLAVSLFVVSLFFSLVILSLWLRIALRYLRFSALHPLSQLIYKITNPMVNPIQRVTRQPYKPGQKYDIPAFITLILMELFKILSINYLGLNGRLPIGGIFLYVIADLIIQPCNILFYAILIRVIMSFVKPDWHGPMADFLRMLTEPLLKIGRKIVPDIAGFDFSPFIIMMILKVITLFISANLPWRML